jgi:Tol biopolymer transport system component
MSAIRRALGERASTPRYITTVSGRGYRFTGDVRQFADEALTIERESFARVTVEQVESESNTAALGSSIRNAIQRLIAHPVLLLAICMLVLAASISTWWGLHRTSAGPLPWTNVTLNRFATHGGVPFRAAISPDGKSLVYRQRINGKDTLWLGQIESNTSVPISNDTGLFYSAMVFSPDGASLYLTVREMNRTRSKLVRMPVLGGVMTDLIENLNGPVTLSPDGQQVAFVRRDGEAKQSSIIIANAADGKNERVLVSRKWPDSFSEKGLSWSPDGKLIAAGATTADGQGAEIVTVSPANGHIDKLSSRAWGDLGNMAWVPNGGGVIVGTRNNAVTRRGQIWFVPFPRGEARKVINDLGLYQIETLSVSATGKLVLLPGHLTSEVLIAPDGDIKRSRVIFKGVEPGYEGVDGLAWKPDGHLLYSSYIGDGQGIWEMDGDGHNLRQLTTPSKNDSVDRQMCLTRDGRYLVFHSNRSGSFQIWRADADGTNLKQLTDGDNNLWPSLSPDGKWVVYSSERESGSVLRRIAIDGGPSEQLTDKTALRPQVSPDGKYIAYFEPSESSRFALVIIPFNGGAPVKRFTVPDTFQMTRAVWTGNGSALMYRDGVEGLWQQRLDQEKPELVHGLEHTEVYQLAWSLDGKNLAYSSGLRMQEILLLEDSK